MKMIKDKKGFEICNHLYEYGNGFHITFKNGVTVSVQFARGMYCDNRDDDVLGYGNENHPSYGKECKSDNAEVMILSGEGVTLPEHKYTEDVMSCVTPEELVDILKWARSIR